MSSEHRDETLILWQIHESLLQAYRGQFLSFQAIAIAAALIATKELTFICNIMHVLILLVLIACGPGFIIFIWIPIVKHRGHMVYSSQLLLIQNTALNESPFSRLRQVSEWGTKERQEVENDQEYKKLTHGSDRYKQDLGISTKS